MDGEILSLIKKEINVLIPIVVAIVAWLLSRIKNPDYGKKDWKCQKLNSTSDEYSIFFITIFMLPILVRIASVATQIAFVKPLAELIIEKKEIPNLVTKIFTTIIVVGIYFFSYGIVRRTKCLLTSKSSDAKIKCILNIITYGPFIVSFLVSIQMAINVHTKYSSYIFGTAIVLFQMLGLTILNDKKVYKNKRMKIYMKDGDCISANVEDVYKKGKWMRIIEQENPRKEKLVVFDDIKSIEYYD